MRLAVVGCGDASFAMGLASRFVRDCTITVACDPDETRRLRFARRFSAQPIEAWDDLIGRTDIDAVYVAVPHDLHGGIAAAFAADGKGVLLEKPVAHRFEAANRFVSELPGDARVAVNYQYRYDPAAWELVRAASTGVVGQIRYARVTVPWYRDAGYFRSGAWHASPERAGGGTLLTQGSHALDIALLACGTPRSGFARTYHRMHTDVMVEDLAMGVVETNAGIPISVLSSMVSRPAGDVHIELIGEKGTLVYTGPRRARIRGRGVRVHRPIVFTELHAYVASLAGFRDWVRGGAPARCSAADGLVVLAAVHALYASASSGRVEACPTPLS